ncbi:DJ-1/PfpI family protein, partial [Stenotrophomonas maltophilia]|nr:DJ-1/PfpI family protein [Stenotrophomonas maltophilia]
MPSPPADPSAPLVAIVACHGQGLFEFGCAVGLFAPVRPELGVAWYRTQLCAGEPGALRMLGGTQVQLPYDLSTVDDADIIVIPGWREPSERPPQALLDALIRAHGRGARIASICSGAFVLAWGGGGGGRPAPPPRGRPPALG